MRSFLRYAHYAVLLPVLCLPVPAEEPGITRQQADQILAELRQIRQLLERQAKGAAQPAQEAPTKARLKLDNTYMLGSKDAPLTMVEFTDYQCPFCQRFQLTTFPEIRKNFIDTGKVRFYSRDMPLDFHSNAFRAAEAARCAGEQGKFWEMRTVMGGNPGRLSLDDISGYAKNLQLDVTAFRACVEGGKYKDAVQADMRTAASVGVNGTPSFVVGKSTPDGVDGELVVGALPYSTFEEKLKSLE